jgi:pyridoxamine 5'-phosphate oxidase family protein
MSRFSLRRKPAPVATTQVSEGSSAMSVFSNKELDYLADRRLGRLATIDASGLPHVVPLGWAYNPALDTIDVGGRDLAATKKFRHVQANPRVALVIDDVLPPWRPRCVMVRGKAEALAEATSADGERLEPIIRIHPSQVISWGLDGAPE